MRAALVLFLVLTVGCAAAPTAEPPLVRGPAGRRALMLVADVTATPERFVAEKVAIEAALELARGDQVPAGVLAATPQGGSVLLPLGDPGNPSLEAVPGKALLARSCRRALDALVAAEAPRGSVIVLLASAEETQELERVSAETSTRGYRVVRAPVEQGARAAIASLAEESFGYLVARGEPATITPRGGRVAAITFEPSLRVKTWTGDARTDVRGTFVLYRPAWEVALEQDAPPPIATVGDPVPIAVTVNGVSALGLPVEATVRADAQLLVLAKSATKSGLRYEGEAEAPRVEGPHELEIRIAFAAGEARFEQVRSFRYLARARVGAPPPDVRVTPHRVDLGAIWSDSAVPITLKVTGDRERPVKVTVESPFASAETLALAPGEEKPLKVTIDPKRLRGSDRLALRAEVTLVATTPVRPVARGERVVPRVAPAEAPPRLLAIPIVCTVPALQLPASFDFGRVKASTSAELSFPLRGAPVEPHVSADPELGITATVEKGSLVLRAKPAKTANGKHMGKVELVLPGSKAPPAARLVSIEVEPAPVLALAVEPATLALKGRYGWAEARLRVTATTAARLAAQPGTLSGTGAQIGARRDIRVASPESLAAGESREVVLRVYLGSDLPAGHYEGTLALEARGDDGQVVRPLPVTVEVER